MLIHFESARGGLVIRWLRDLEQLLFLSFHHLDISSNLVVCELGVAEECRLVSHDILERSLDVLGCIFTYSVLSGSEWFLNGVLLVLV